MYIHVCICIYMCVCIYMYVYICICMYMCIYICVLFFSVDNLKLLLQPTQQHHRMFSRLGGLLYSALSSKSRNDKTHACTLTRHYTAQGTWPSMWNHYTGFLPPAECRWDAGPTYYSPDVPVIHHCLPCPHRALEDVWSMAPDCVYVCAPACMFVCLCWTVIVISYLMHMYICMCGPHSLSLSLFLSVCHHLFFFGLLSQWFV